MVAVTVCNDHVSHSQSDVLLIVWGGGGVVGLALVVLGLVVPWHGVALGLSMEFGVGLIAIPIIDIVVMRLFYETARPEDRPDDGLLDVLVIDPNSPADWIRTTAGIITRTGRDTDPSRIRFRGSELMISTGHVRKRQIDGDLVTPGSGLTVGVLPRALMIRVLTDRSRATPRGG